MILLIAWRNVWRNPLRSMLVITAVALGLWAGAFVMGYSIGIINQRLQTAIEKEVSHFQIHHPKFSEDFDPALVIPQGGVKLGHLRSDSYVKAVSPRVIAVGMAASAKQSAAARVFGVMPAREQSVTGLQDKVVEGEYFNDKKNRIIIGRKLADKLNVKLRSKVVLTFQNKDKDIVAGAFRVIGIYETTNPGYDEMNLFVKALDLGELLQVPGQFHEIAGLLHDPELVEPFADVLKAKYKESLTETWREVSPELGLMVDSFNQYIYIFMIIILLALSFGIVNTMLMAVLERVREIGMLMAVGMNRRKLFAMIFFETIMLVMVAAPVGLLLAFSTISYFGTQGMDISGMYSGHESLGFETFIYPKLEGIYYLRIMILVIITAVLASIYPAVTALKLNPVEAIRKI